MIRDIPYLFLLFELIGGDAKDKHVGLMVWTEIFNQLHK